jgi:DNA polymerase-3 subunit gamma/tau
LEALWAQLTDAVARVSRFTANYLINAHPVSFAKGVFVIGYDPEFEDQMGLADNPKNHTLLQTKLAELGHPNSQFKFVKAEAPVGRVPVAAPAPVAPATPQPKTAPAAAKAAAPVADKKASVPFNKDDFKNDPLIQKALEVFKGQIVEVRA